MKIRDIIKMTTKNTGQRTLLESVASNEVEIALKDWIKYNSSNGILIGGAACGFYSRPRMTFDLDMLYLTNSDIPKNVTNFKKIRNHCFQHIQTHVEIEVITPEFININPLLVKQVIDNSIVSDGLRIASPAGLVALKLQRMERYDYGDIWELLEYDNINLNGWLISDEQLKLFNDIHNKVYKTS